LLLDKVSLRAAVVTGPATDNEAGCRAIREAMDTLPINARRSAAELVDAVLTEAGLPGRRRPELGMVRAK
jgi:hypothetical protein